MPKGRKDTTAPSGEPEVPGTDVDVRSTDDENIIDPVEIDDEDQDHDGTDVEPLDPDVIAAVDRARAYIDMRGFGPKTTMLVSWIAGQALDGADLNVVILEQLAERLAAAESPMDILMPFQPSKGKDFLDKPIRIMDAEFLESAHEESFPFYVSLVIALPPDGKEEVVTIGGEQLVMQVAGLKANGLLPTYCKITESKRPTKAGYYPLRLGPTT